MSTRLKIICNLSASSGQKNSWSFPIEESSEESSVGSVCCCVADENIVPFYFLLLKPLPAVLSNKHMTNVTGLHTNTCVFKIKYRPE